MLIKRIRKSLKRISQIPLIQHKPYYQILIEVINWTISNRGTVNDYFDYELYVKNKNPNEYIKRRQYLKIDRKINSTKYYSILEDKYFFHHIVSGNGLNLPNTLYLIENSSIFSLVAKNYISVETFLENDFDGFCKVINGWGGSNIFLIEIFNKKLKFNGDNMSVSDLFKLLGSKKFLIQERIIQHKDMILLNPSCINTLRIVTIKIGHIIHIFHVIQRIGINGSYVDNSLSGNIFIGVHKDSGKLMDYAIKPDVQNFKIYEHPQTNIVFKDFSIPFYNEAIEMTKSLHLLFQQFFMIGWDIGITPEGPIVIEGNQVADLYYAQLLFGGLKSEYLSYSHEYQTMH